MKKKNSKPFFDTNNELPEQTEARVFYWRKKKEEELEKRQATERKRRKRGTAEVLRERERTVNFVTLDHLWQKIEEEWVWFDMGHCLQEQLTCSLATEEEEEARNEEMELCPPLVLLLVTLSYTMLSFLLE